MANTSLILDRYRVIDQAGAGGYGTVIHAYDTRLKRDVAIKCIELSEADVAKARLLAMEAQFQNEQVQEEPEVLPWEEAEEETESSWKNLLPDIDFPWEEPLTEGEEGDFASTAWNDSLPVLSPNFPADPAFLDRKNPASAPELAPFSAKAEEAELDEDALFDHIPGLEEARTAAHLNDANIVTVYDCEVHGSTAYVIMEYIEGKTLSQLMREVGDDIDLDIVAAVFASVAHALEVAHDNDVLHLDIKPENVIVNKKGVVKVTDFGLATLMDASGQATTGGGTIGYMPLEQMRQQPLDVRTDEWALASLTYEMLSGSNPFFADNLQRAEELIENAELVLPSLCWDTLGETADDILFDALDPNPDERYPSVAKFSEALTPLLGDAKVGKKALAKLVSNGTAEAAEEEPAPREPLPPVIDRLGEKGAKIIGRVIATLGAAGIAAVALINIRFNEAAVYGVASDYAVVFWIALAAVAALTAFFPTYGVLLAFLLFAVMLIFNWAIIPAVVLMLVAGVWWWFCGRHVEGGAIAAALQPLCGAIGLTAVAPVAAGVMTTVRDAALTALFIAVSAMIFASLGSTDISYWNVFAHAITAGSSEVSGPSITSNFITVVTSAETWFIAVSWILAATVYSLLCEKGTRLFDIIGSVIAAAILLVGVIFGAGAEVLLAAVMPNAIPDTSAGIATWNFNTVAIIGALAAGILGIILAIMDVPDRIRLEEGEW